MSVNDLLTQEEIDALLSGKSADEVIIRDKKALPEKNNPHETSVEDWGDNHQIPALGMINGRYAQLFSKIFFNFLRKDAEVTVKDVTLLNFSEYLDSLYVPSSINIVRFKPLKDSALFVFNPELVSLVVDTYFGGNGEIQSNVKNKEFTPAELRIIDVLLDKILVVLNKVWEPVMPLIFERQKIADDIKTSEVIDNDEKVVVSSFSVDIAHNSGELHICTPYSMLEDILGTEV